MNANRNKKHRKRDAVERSIESKTDARRPYVSPLELGILAIIFIAGISLRLAFPERTTVEHFDEGVYASNLLFDEQTNFQYPLRHLYAPPLVPALIEGSMVLSGRISGTAAIAPSWIVGCVSIVLVWWLVRFWFGSGAGLAAACLAATSDAHAMFTRTALTDACLLFFFLAAVLAFAHALRTQRWLAFIVAGGLVGLAWWTKYNGWLPLLVVLAAIVAHIVTNRSHSGQSWRLVVGWLAAAVTAAVTWSPYLYALQRHGGYSQVAANHSKYIVGFSGWLSSLQQQLANLNHVDSAWGSLGWGAAVFVAWLLQRRCAPRRGERVLVRWGEGLTALGASVAVTLLASWIGSGVLLLSVAAVAVITALGIRLAKWRKPISDSPAKNPDSTEWYDVPDGQWLMISWYALLLVMTPLYTPYLRLTLPLIAASWCAAAWGIGSLWRSLPVSKTTTDSSGISIDSVAMVGGLLILLGMFAAAKFAPRPAWLDDRRGLLGVASEIDRVIGQGGVQAVNNPAANAERLRVVYVYGEPALLFQLRALGQPIVMPVDTVDVQPVIQNGMEIPTFLIAGLHAKNDPAFQTGFEKEEGRLDLVGSYAYRPSATVLSDQYDPRRMTQQETIAEVKLYRVK